MTPTTKAAGPSDTVLGFVRREVSEAESSTVTLPLDLFVGSEVPPILETEIAFGYFHRDGARTGDEILIRWYTHGMRGTTIPLVRVSGGGYQLLKSLSCVILRLAEMSFFTPDEVTALLAEAGLEDLSTPDDQTYSK